MLEIISQGKFPIKVSSEVVSHLSKGLYSNFARAVKELISNSYDAQCTEVKINLDLKNKTLIIRDNGRGMNLNEIEHEFLIIGPPLESKHDLNEMNRRRIGTFGIGFLSTFPYCKKLQIITKSRNSNQIVEIEIDTEQFFKEGQFLIEDIEVLYKTYISDIPQEKGETIILLKQIKDHIIEDLSLESPSKSSLHKLVGYEKFKWSLSQYAPIQFPPQRKDLRDFFNYYKTIPMRLWLNGVELFRNIPKDAEILEKKNHQIGNILFKYTIMTPNKTVVPEEARGLQIRLRDVAIGFPRDFDVIKFTGKVPGKLNYLCGEIHILEGLESELMVDRDNFSYTREMAEFENFFRKKLVEWNDKLEKWASEDKEVYETLEGLESSEDIIETLQDADIIRFSKERMRISKSSSITVSKKDKQISTPSTKLAKSLSKKMNVKVFQDDRKVTDKDKPIAMKDDNTVIVIYSKHPIFIEKIKIKEKEFFVNYDEWDYKRTSYSICKIVDEKTVVFNRTHPLFKTKLNDEIIKKLALGLIFAVKGFQDEKKLLNNLNKLLEDVFLGD